MEEYIYLTIIGLLVVVVVLILIINKDSKLKQNQKLEQLMNDHNNNLKFEILKVINESSHVSQTELFKSINNQFEVITNKVNTSINQSFKKTDETFVGVAERLAKIDEHNKNITNLASEVLTLNNILTDKQTRGIFGEIQLNKILEAVLGKNKELYELQKTLSNKRIVDAIIYAPEPLGSISIDSKFPLESYQKMTDHNLTKEEQERYKKQFSRDLKTHVNNIKERYIITNETANQAIMFIPAEAIFLEIVTNFNDIINYAYENNVWLASPTTLISSLSLIETVSNSIKQNEQTTLLVDELKYLANEFRKYMERFEKIKNRVSGLTKDIDELNITTNIIFNKFKDIEAGKLD